MFSYTLPLTSVSSTVTQLAPVEINIIPNQTLDSVYKMDYDFGDNTTQQVILDFNNPILTNPSKIAVTKQYELNPDDFPNFITSYNLRVSAYKINTSTPLIYSFTIQLQYPSLLDLGEGFFDTVKIVKTRYLSDRISWVLFETSNPNYLLPVIIDWKKI